jgi:hypothetical protein
VAEAGDALTSFNHDARIPVMPVLRTTLSLEADVAARVRRELASGRLSLKQVINERLRAGFGMVTRPGGKAFAVHPHASAYRPGVDRTKLNQLVDELAAEEFAAARGRRRAR